VQTVHHSSFRDNTSTESSLLSFLALGDGWHNYHVSWRFEYLIFGVNIFFSRQHAFPTDYRSTELPGFNAGTAFIDFFAWIGWATDLKTGRQLRRTQRFMNFKSIQSSTVPDKVVMERLQRTGDGSHIRSKQKFDQSDLTS
jgi:stearoyl-CoA desaturase (Delta-9 desaturase)